MKRLNYSSLTVLAGLILAFLDMSAFAQAGSLDKTFGKNGVAETTLTSDNDINGVIPFSVQLQSSGDIVVLADVVETSTTTDVLRYTTSGVLDATFGQKGIAVLPTTVGPATLALQPNGQILIAGVGPSELVVERLNSNGTIDGSFGSDGVASVSLGERGTGDQVVLLVESNGEILLGSQLSPTGRGQPAQVILARFSSAGALDSTFGSNGTTISSAIAGCTALAELSSGGILVVNSQEIVQFTFSGSPQSTVSGGAIVATAGSAALSAPSLFQSNSDYLLAQPLFVGEESRGHNSSVQVLRFTSNGSADSTFTSPTFHFSGNGGFGIEAIPEAMALQSNGDIVIVGEQSTESQSGSTTVNGLARLTPSGGLDSTFGNKGTVTNSVPAGAQGLNAVVIQSNGDIVAIGLASDSTALTVSRYLGK